MAISQLDCSLSMQEDIRFTTRGRHAFMHMEMPWSLDPAEESSGETKSSLSSLPTVCLLSFTILSVKLPTSFFSS